MRIQGTICRAVTPGLCVGLLLAVCLPASAEVIDFASDRWLKYNGEVVEHLGRTCLNGSAYLPNIQFTNGIIEYDVTVDGSRSYPGITFRAVSQLEYEEFYIRPHVSNRPDAMQYTPVFSGVSGWQLYNGDGFNAALEIPRDEWIHIKLEILDSQARVFVNDSEEPALVVPELKQTPVAGAIGVKSQRNGSVYFSNFQVVKTDDLEFEPPALPVPPRGLITEWEISQPFKAVAVSRRYYPDQELLAEIQWQTAATEPNGLLDFCRHVRRNATSGPDVIFARIHLEAERDEMRQFSFGYSDVATVFLNGEWMSYWNNRRLSSAVQ
ncbi:MAG: hypothetical protein ABIF77_12440 [bacterium]